jgi:hypothetical protein
MFSYPRSFSCLDQGFRKHFKFVYNFGNASMVEKRPLVMTK